ncbi:hypothetical protein [Legionella brunensis]|uniref:Uncharacterized protein n=1 Tax=Legionella brunensis TaxID=29422 RepID=A0A0W0SD18_9GAMM|nr:hypothetical protein [Legionella brunensis]KTC81368.1 hypothetical protein Lbru_1888 [Legionella brunensis]
MKNEKQPSERKARELLHDIKMKVRSLGKRIVDDWIQSNIDGESLGEWLRLKTVINMNHVCNAFYRGSAFYRSDNYHFANAIQPRDENNETITTMASLGPIDYYGLTDETYDQLHVCSSYTIAEGNHSPSQILLDLLFSRTSLDCSAALQIANYLTLLDALKLCHGAKGAQIFDTVFGSKPNEAHNLNQLRFGTMGCFWSADWHDFSPLYFFTVYGEPKVTLENLQNDPDKYVGSRFYIRGNVNYSNKHPRESAQGWNVIFLGLDENRAPLFLAACEVGQRFIFTYQEMLAILEAGFNKFPEYQNNQYASSFCQEGDLVGLKENSQLLFDTLRVKVLLTHPSECIKILSDYCQRNYTRAVLPEGYDTTSKNISPKVIHLPVIQEVKDDHDATLLKFCKSDFRPDPVELRVRDDLDRSLETIRRRHLYFFNDEEARKTYKFIKKAARLLNDIYAADSVEDEEIAIYLQKTLVRINKLEEQLRQNKLQQEELKSLTDFVEQLEVIETERNQPL